MWFSGLKVSMLATIFGQIMIMEIIFNFMLNLAWRYVGFKSLTTWGLKNLIWFAGKAPLYFWVIFTFRNYNIFFYLLININHLSKFCLIITHFHQIKTKFIKLYQNNFWKSSELEVLINEQVAAWCWLLILTLKYVIYLFRSNFLSLKNIAIFEYKKLHRNSSKKVIIVQFIISELL